MQSSSRIIRALCDLPRERLRLSHRKNNPNSLGEHLVMLGFEPGLAVDVADPKVRFPKCDLRRRDPQ
jgi:hypothetical protein